jgi:hypothetical protein
MKILLPLTKKIDLCIYELSETNDSGRAAIYARHGLSDITMAQILYSNKHVELDGVLRELDCDCLVERLSPTPSSIIFVFRDGSAIVEETCRFFMIQFIK